MFEDHRSCLCRRQVFSSETFTLSHSVKSVYSKREIIPYTTAQAVRSASSKASRNKNKVANEMQ